MVENQTLRLKLGSLIRNFAMLDMLSDPDDLVAAGTANRLAELILEAIANQDGVQPLPVRAEVAAFAQLMEQELQANDWKGGWGECALVGRRSLFERIGEETSELKRVLDAAHKPIWTAFDFNEPGYGNWNVNVRRLRDGTWERSLPGQAKPFDPDEEEVEQIGSEAADIANFAMMIADRAGALKRRNATK